MDKLYFSISQENLVDVFEFLSSSMLNYSDKLEFSISRIYIIVTFMSCKLDKSDFL